jgi:hypothetical protein
MNDARWPVAIFVAAMLALAGLSYLGFDRWSAYP